MLDFLPEEKVRILRDYPPLWDFLEKKRLSRKEQKIFIENWNVFKDELREKGITEDDFYLLLLNKKHNSFILDLSYFDLGLLEDYYKKKTHIDFEFISPYAHNYKPTTTELANKEMIGLVLGLFFKKKFPESIHCVLFDDYNSDNSHHGEKVLLRLLEKESREKYGQPSIIDEERIIYESHKIKPAEEMIAVMKESTSKNRFSIKEKRDGSIWFNFKTKPRDTSGSRLTEWFRERFGSDSILLKAKNGKYTCEMLDSATFWGKDPFLGIDNKEIFHVIGLPFDYITQQQRVRKILVALGYDGSKHQNIFFNPNIKPEVIMKALIEELRKKKKTQEGAMGKIGPLKRKEYTPWENFDPWEYANRNYGRGVLPEDRIIIQAVSKAFTKMGVKLSQFESVADIGAGPNLYPAMLLAPFVKDSGFIKLIEYSLPNIQYLKVVLNPNARGQAMIHRRAWEEYGRHIEKICGEQYKGVFERVQRLVKVEAGNIYGLYPKQFDAISSYFVTESITDNLDKFQSALNSAVNSLRPRGVFMIAHMLESKGYHAGVGTHFPAISLTISDLERAYSNTGATFRDFNITEAYASKGEKKPREGYHGMVVVTGQRAP